MVGVPGFDRAAAEREYTLRHELGARRASDPLGKWTPHPKQREFIDACLGLEAEELWLMGGNRSGKSDCGAFVGSRLARFGFNDPASIYAGSGKDFIEVRDRATSGWVIGVDNNAIRDVIQTKYFDNGFVPPGANEPFIPEREIKRYDRIANILQLKNGSLIGYKSGESDLQAFYGAGKDWIQYDEVPRHEVYDECGIRIEGGRRLLQFGTATLLPPEGMVGGVSWLYETRIRDWKADRLDPAKFRLWTMSVYDNPHLSPSEIGRLEEKYPVETPIGQIRLMGALLPGIAGARAYPSFNPELHIREQPDPPPMRPLAWCWDFNVEPMITLIGWRDDRTFRFCDELTIETGASIQAMCEAFYAKWGYRHQGEVWIYGDATGGGRSAQTGDSSYRLMWQELLPHNLQLRKRVPLKNPFVIDRLNAFNRALKPKDEAPLVEIDPKCRELVADLEQVLVDSVGGIAKSRRPSDPYYKRTHASDSGGYWVAYDAPVRAAHQLASREKRVPKAPGYGFAAGSTAYRGRLVR